MTPSPTPRVTVLTATYNGAQFLRPTVESILAQTFEDFEYIVVDDASPDDSFRIVENYARKDLRIRLLRNAQNLNPAGALNRGLQEARGEYVAILDHDDLALPTRLARQVAYLDAHPDTGAIGAQVRIIDESGSYVKSHRFPTESTFARWELLFSAPLLHSASMYRRALLQELGGYSARHPYLCDYELLFRVAERSRIANLDEELTCYRRSSTQVSSTHHQPQNGQMLLLQFAMQHRWLGLRPDLRVFQTLLGWLRRVPPPDAEQAHAAQDWLARLWTRYQAVTSLSPCEVKILQQRMALRWLSLAHIAYATQRTAARACWHLALELDPHLLERPESWARLRQKPKANART